MTNGTNSNLELAWFTKVTNIRRNSKHTHAQQHTSRAPEQLGRTERGVGGRDEGEMKNRGLAQTDMEGVSQTDARSLSGRFPPGPFPSDAYLLQGQKGSQGQTSLPLQSGDDIYPERRTARCRDGSLTHPGPLNLQSCSKRQRPGR